MKKYVYLLLMLLGILPFASCKKWLDVDPKAQISATDLLSTNEGYASALGGVYYTLSKPSLYGKELQYNLLDVLAQYWDVNATTHSMYQAGKYNYQDQNTLLKINAIWSDMYMAIANTNQILQSLEKTDAKTISHYNLIKGEALGLRAYIHMELLKMFGQVIKTDGMDKPAIPYRTNFDHTAKKFETTRAVLQLIDKDLNEAKVLLADDPIKTLGRIGGANSTGSLNYDAILDRRGSRMNCYAVLGLLARNAQLRGDQDGAYQYAMQLINEVKTNNNVIRFTAANEIYTPSIVNFRDIKFSAEMIFSLYDRDQYKNAGPLFGYPDYAQSSNQGLLVNYSRMKNFVYASTTDGSGDDYRFKYWFPSAGSPIFLKFIAAVESSGLGVGYYPEFCLMRLPEMYFIAAESQIGKNNQLVLDLLNQVRVTRGLIQPLSLNTLNTNEALLTAIVNEERREYLGEGQLFLLHKRLFRDIIMDNGSKITASASIFVFPIPDSEYEFSPNVK